VAGIEQVGSMSNDLRRNASGYMDLTAYYAVKAADKKLANKKRGDTGKTDPQTVNSKLNFKNRRRLNNEFSKK